MRLGFLVEYLAHVRLFDEFQAAEEGSERLWDDDGAVGALAVL